jgi:hypothetical protein
MMGDCVTGATTGDATGAVSFFCSATMTGATVETGCGALVTIAAGAIAARAARKSFLLSWVIDFLSAGTTGAPGDEGAVAERGTFVLRLFKS